MSLELLVPLKVRLKSGKLKKKSLSIVGGLVSFGSFLFVISDFNMHFSLSLTVRGNTTTTKDYLLQVRERLFFAWLNQCLYY